MGKSFEQDIASVASIKAIPTILDVVCRTTGMRFAAVARVTEDRWIACSVRDEISFGLQPGGELKVESTICHEIRQSGKAVIIDNVADDPAYSTHHTLRAYGLQSYISMPIRLQDNSFFGTLCAIDPEPHRLNTPEVVAMVEMFADVIGYHLSTIDLMNATEATLLNERKTAALREQFIAVLGHDLRNPLAAIEAGVRMIESAPAKVVTIAPLIQQSVRRMAGLIDDVMDFARGRLGGGLALNRDGKKPLKEIIETVVAELRASSPDRVIEVNYAMNASVDCDRRRIGQLVSNLLGNAITHGAKGEPIRLSATTADGLFELAVANSGDPIPPTVIEHIFEPFTRGALRPSLQGLGLGLYIAQSIAEAHGGKLSVSSTPEETRFTFRMPLNVVWG